MPVDNLGGAAVCESYALTLSHVVIDEIWRPGAQRAIEAIGGAGTHAVMGQALAYGLQGEAVIVSGVGADFPARVRELMRQARVRDECLAPVEEFTPRTVVRYATDEERTEHPAFGAAHFVRCDPQLAMVPDALRAPEAIYIFAGVTEPAWEVVDVAPAATVTWELDVAVCHPRFWNAIRERSRSVDVVSLNEQELARLMGGSGKDALRQAIDNLFPGVSAAALRRGERGALLATRDAVWDARPDLRRPKVDPTGAGNAFSGALSIEWARTPNDPARALRRAMAAAAVTIHRQGALLPLLHETRDEFELIAAGQEATPSPWKEPDNE